MSKNTSDKDIKDWEDFLSKKEALPNKDVTPLKNTVSKVKTCDLHGYSLEEANRKIRELILDAYENRVNKLIIVTGKGLHSQNDKDPYVSKDLGILKYSVPDYINSNEDLMNIIHEIKDANSEDGGSGAFYIFLKKKIIK